MRFRERRGGVGLVVLAMTDAIASIFFDLREGENVLAVVLYADDEVSMLASAWSAWMKVPTLLSDNL